MKEAKRWKRLLVLALCCALLSTVIPATTTSASPYDATGDWSNGYGWWSQQQSKYSGMREVGCLIVAQAKMLAKYCFGGDSCCSWFNPDTHYEWLLNNGYIPGVNDLTMKYHAAPVWFAAEKGITMYYEGQTNWNYTDGIWSNINSGKATILKLNDGAHWVLVNNESSQANGEIYIFQSFSWSNNLPGTRRLASESVSTISGYLTYSFAPVCSHSWNSGVVTKAATCTADGEKTFTCTKCGETKTGGIAKLGHDYQLTLETEPNCTEDGVTEYTCSRCADSYQDITPAKGHAYRGVLVEGADGTKRTQLVCDVCDNTVQVTREWIELNALPVDLPENLFDIEYRAIQTTVASQSPGKDWVNVGIASTHYENSGSVYESDFALSTSDTRVHVGTYYYHYCGAYVGSNANYCWTNDYYDYHAIGSIDQYDVADSFTDFDDARYTVYNIKWKAGQWAGGWATCREDRSSYYYRRYQYQDRVLVNDYTWEYDSGWTTSFTPCGNSCSVRVRAKDLADPVVQQLLVSEITPNSFTLNCKASDDTGIAKVVFSISTSIDATDVVEYAVVPQESGSLFEASTKVMISEFSNMRDCAYNCTVTAYDSVDNVVLAKTKVLMPTLMRSGYRLTLPENLEKIEESAFEGDTRIGEVVLPDGAEKIGEKAFASCSRLVLVEIPDSVTEIAANAFEDSLDVVLLCSAESAAAAFAAENGIPYLTALK